MLATKTRATYEDLMRTEGKAELIDGEIVTYPFLGSLPARLKGEIFFSLHHYREQVKWGRAFGSSIGFKVDLPHRQSFCADAGYYSTPCPGMGFVEGAPLFAVEMKHRNEDFAHTEQEMADKREDYFTAGTKVVWSVDIDSEIVVRKYTADNPTVPTEYRRGEIADAEPALPGWTMPVDAIFP